jgi:hypothetical protein
MLIGIASISFSNATVQILLESDAVSESIANARSTGLELEVKHSVAANPARIQDAAAALGMVPTEQIPTLDATSSLSTEAKSALNEVQAEHPVAAQLAAAAGNADNADNADNAATAGNASNANNAGKKTPASSKETPAPSTAS